MSGLVEAETLDIPHEMREALGFGAMEWDFADWFCLDHEVVLKTDGARFSARSDGDGRRVILASSNGPNALLFARSLRTESHEGHPHDAHSGLCGHRDCKITHFGHVVVTVPVRVGAENLDESTYSCTEPETQLLDFLGRKRPL